MVSPRGWASLPSSLSIQDLPHLFSFFYLRKESATEVERVLSQLPTRTHLPPLSPPLLWRCESFFVSFLPTNSLFPVLDYFRPQRLSFLLSPSVWHSPLGPSSTRRCRLSFLLCLVWEQCSLRLSPLRTRTRRSLSLCVGRDEDKLRHMVECGCVPLSYLLEKYRVCFFVL